MEIRKKPHAAGKTKAGDTSERVGVEQIVARGVNIKELIEKLIDAAGAEFTTYYYYTILRMHLAGHEDYTGSTTRRDGFTTAFEFRHDRGGPRTRPAAGRTSSSAALPPPRSGVF